MRGARIGNNSCRETDLDDSMSKKSKIAASVPVWRESVQIAELPDGRVGPAPRHVGLRLALHLQVVRGQLGPVCQVPHDVEEPVAHPSWEIRHFVFGAFLHKRQHLAVLLGVSGTYTRLATLAVVLDVDVLVVLASALWVSSVAETALLVDGAVGSPGLVVVRADLPAGLRLDGTRGDAHALGLTFRVHFADSTSAAVDLNARIYQWNFVVLDLFVWDFRWRLHLRFFRFALADVSFFGGLPVLPVLLVFPLKYRGQNWSKPQLSTYGLLGVALGDEEQDHDQEGQVEKFHPDW